MNSLKNRFVIVPGLHYLCRRIPSPRRCPGPSGTAPGLGIPESYETMTRKIIYPCVGTCSTQITIELEDGIIREVAFTGGCHGNTQGVAALVHGMRAEEAVARLKGIDCRGRGTSCPDQLARALEQAMH